MKYWDIIWVTKLQYPAELWLSLSALWRTPIFDTFLKIEFGKGCGSMMTPLHATTIGVNFELSIRLSQSSISQIIFTVLTNTNSDQIKGKTWWREHHTAMPVYLHKYCHYSSYLVITFCCIIIHHSIIGSKHHTAQHSDGVKKKMICSCCAEFLWMPRSLLVSTPHTYTCYYNVSVWCHNKAAACIMYLLRSPELGQRNANHCSA